MYKQQIFKFSFSNYFDLVTETFIFWGWSNHIHMYVCTMYYWPSLVWTHHICVHNIPQKFPLIFFTPHTYTSVAASNIFFAPKCPQKIYQRFKTTSTVLNKMDFQSKITTFWNSTSRKAILLQEIESFINDGKTKIDNPILNQSGSFLSADLDYLESKSFIYSFSDIHI